MIRSPRGVVLPIVLLLILGMAALSTSALVLARTELVADRSGQKQVRDRDLADRVLRAEPGTQGFERHIKVLPAGFQLVEARPDAPGLSYFAVAWALDPDSVLARLPGALEATGILPTGGVSRKDGCATGSTELVVRRPPSLGPDGVLGEATPRLGLLGVSELIALPGVDLISSAPLPLLSTHQILRARGSVFEVRGGEGLGLLVSDGDLTLDGATRLGGLLVVAGNLTLQDSALFEGVAVVGGEVRISGAAQLLGCPDLALEVLHLPELARVHHLPGGGFLGRH